MNRVPFPQTGALAWPAVAAVYFLIALFGFGRPADAAPPYAEEWSTIGAPQDVEVDPSGRVWVACFDDFVRVYAPTGGELLFTFGGTGAGAGEFNNPYGMAFDPSGDVYICDYAGARVQKFTSDGTYLLEWAIPSDRADHVAIDAAGDVYVSGFNDFSVHKYTSTGGSLLDWTSISGSRPSGVVVLGNTVHVVQWDASVVEQFDTDGTPLGSFDAFLVNGTDVELDASDQLWVVDYSANEARLFTSDGVLVDAFGGPGTGPGEFNGLQGIAIGLDGSIYIADESNGRVQRFGDPITSDVDLPIGLPDPLAIHPLAPNPCRTSVELTYSTPRAEPLRMTVTDVLGREVATLSDGPVAAGEHRLRWTPEQSDGRRLPAGVYLVRLAGRSGVQTTRLVVTR